MVCQRPSALPDLRGWRPSRPSEGENKDSTLNGWMVWTSSIPSPWCRKRQDWASSWESSGSEPGVRGKITRSQEERGVPGRPMPLPSISSLSIVDVSAIRSAYSRAKMTLITVLLHCCSMAGWPEETSTAWWRPFGRHFTVRQDSIHNQFDVKYDEFYLAKSFSDHVSSR